jgi:hypothetical protein
MCEKSGLFMGVSWTRQKLGSTRGGGELGEDGHSNVANGRRVGLQPVWGEPEGNNHGSTHKITTCGMRKEKN